MLVHTCSRTLFVRARVCAQDADFTVLPFLQPMSTTICVYPSAWNTRMEMCLTCRWECDSCSKAWALRRFIYCFNDAVCFIYMYFVRNDEIKTVNLNLNLSKIPMNCGTVSHEIAFIARKCSRVSYLNIGCGIFKCGYFKNIQSIYYFQHAS